VRLLLKGKEKENFQKKKFMTLESDSPPDYAK